MWLKLSPPSPTGSRSTVSLPPPSPSLSPSASPDVTNACKRKRDVHSSLPATPAQSPCPDATPLSTTGPFSGISTTGKDLCEDVGSCGDDYVMRDFFAATALSKRRSERSRAPISYAGCDVDEDPDMRVRGKAKLGKLKLKAARLTSTNETRPTKGKKSSNGKSKISCPFAFVCSSPLFGRFSDVVRHLEANELHTHAEVTRYQCGKCQAYLSRADSLQRHVSTEACDKRSPSEKVKPDYTPEEEKELDRIRNSDHPAIVGAKEKMRLSAQERM
ncbi:hypothetical protein H0H87_012714 [Tephrocybe sp. NHM501043]|nr:hypothetical protein H0H87_012714 [Tephrocybe sp. NHM501043]